MIRNVVVVIVAGAGLFGGLSAGGGCARDGAGRLDGQAMLRPPRALRVESEPISAVDQPGALSDASIQGDPVRAAGPAADRRPDLRDISPSVRQSVRAPGDDAGRAPAGATTAPAAATDAGGGAGVAPAGGGLGIATTSPAPDPATPAAAAGGTYWTVGALVAEVNNAPIYAGDVLAPIQGDLASKARALDEAKFRAYAQKRIAEQVNEMIQAELEYQAATRVLTAQEKQYAADMTARWRQQQVSDAGGSEETARRRARAKGLDFDKQVAEQNRVHVRMLFNQKRLVHRVAPSADDIRRQYDRELASKHTIRDAARFEMIKIDPARVGSRDEARAKAEDLRRRAVAGEDFSKLAEFSHGPRLRPAAGGELPWIERGAFAVGEVEEQVWKLQPEQVTPVFEAGGAFYVARLDAKRTGRVKPFEEVQDAIRAELHKQEFLRLRQKVLLDLYRQAVVRGSPDKGTEMMQPAVDMAMQQYPRWAGT